MNSSPPVIEAALAPPLVPGNAIVISALHLAALSAAGILPLGAPPLSLLACPFRAITGLPCLGCGCVHAFAAVARLEFGAAFLANPLGALVAIGGICFAVGTVLRLLSVALPLPRIPRGRARLGRIAVVLAVAANWTFVALRVSR
ncbi:MAG: DUF2752 domain-containing protein [Myxococcales bacterium]